MRDTWELENREETDEEDHEENKNSVDNVTEHKSKPKDEGKGVQPDDKTDESSEGNKEFDSQWEKALRHKELYGRCSWWIAEEPMNLEESELMFYTGYFLGSAFPLGLW